MIASTEIRKRMPFVPGAFSSLNRLARLCDVAMMVCALGCGNKQPEPPAQVTTIPGTFSWSVAAGKFSGHKGDLAWEHISETTRNLVPMNGTRMKCVSNRAFDDIDLRFIKRQTLSPEKISGSDTGGILHVGSVIIFKTAEGRYGKVRIEGFASLHDFSFPELAAAFSDQSRFDVWKSAALGKPDSNKYHLVVKWVLYP